MSAFRSDRKAKPRARRVFAIILAATALLCSLVAEASLPIDSRTQPTAITDEAAARQPAGSDAAPVQADLTLDRIHAELKEHISRIKDVTARVRFVQISPRDGSKIEGELELAAILPDLARATWIKPEIYAGVFYILDAQANWYIEYVPATGEAHRLPLDQVLAGQSLVQISPDQIFSLPSAEQFHLELAAVTELNGVRYAVVKATEKASGQVYRVWVDTGRWLVTRMQSVSPSGEIQATAEVLDIRVNQGLEAAALRRLPPGTIHRSYP